MSFDQLRRNLASLSDEDLTFEFWCQYGKYLDNIGDGYPTEVQKTIVNAIQNEGLKRGLITK